jgi:ring-1,2-phenylacetyl-CoA epoxidase subunit PaaD
MVNPERDAVAATQEAAVAGDSALRPSLATLWRALDAVPDPEIPAVSVHELGMVRGLEWDEADPATLVVHLTPTYSGCPATDAIRESVADALLAQGAPRVRVALRLAPAWTTDWMTQDARQKLRDFGIAPPAGAARAGVVAVSAIGGMRRAAAKIACPRCGSRNTECIAQFGSTACKAHYRCVDCAEPFDYFKPF